MPQPFDDPFWAQNRTPVEDPSSISPFGDPRPVKIEGAFRGSKTVSKIDRYSVLNLEDCTVLLYAYTTQGYNGTQLPFLELATPAYQEAMKNARSETAYANGGSRCQSLP